MNAMRLAMAAMLFGAGAAGAQTPPPAKSLVPQAAPVASPSATVDLGAEVPAMKGYELVQFFYTVAPGTGRPWHSHAGAPEIVRILAGTLTDQRNDGKPIAYGAGATIVNAGGTQHMWANLGTEPVVFVTTQVRPVKK